MTTIGQFSLSTGLSIKTLRYYDSIGLLPAAEVDASSGYRSYRASQMRDAALLRVLRASGMGVPEMRRALEHPEELDAVLAKRRAELAAQRELEDWALDQAPSWQTIDVSVVGTRSCEAEHWVGVVVPIDMREGEEGEAGEEADAVAQAGVERLVEALAARGLFEGKSASDFWTEFRADSARTRTIHMAHCFRVAEPVRLDVRVEGAEVESGTLPRRTEAFVTQPLMSPEEMADAWGEGPAGRLSGGFLPPREAIALAMVAEDAGAEDPIVRQRTRTADGEPLLEWSVTISS